MPTARRELTAKQILPRALGSSKRAFIADSRRVCTFLSTMYALQRSCVYIARCPFPRVLVPRRRAHASAVFSQLTTGQNFLAKAPPGLLTRPWDGSEEQVKALQEVMQQVQQSSFEAPDLATVQWFLRDRDFDVEETVSKLTKYLVWRAECRPQQLSGQDVAGEAATGKAYLHEHTDVYGRPVIVIRARLHVTGEAALEDSKRYCAFLMEQALKAMPSGTETILGVFDLRGFAPRNADFGFVRFLIDVFFLYYPKRLGQVLLVEAPWAFEPGWKLVKPWLRKYAGLVRFVKAEELRREYFTPETVPPDF